MMAAEIVRRVRRALVKAVESVAGPKAANLVERETHQSAPHSPGSTARSREPGLCGALVVVFTEYSYLDLQPVVEAFRDALKREGLFLEVVDSGTSVVRRRA